MQECRRCATPMVKGHGMVCALTWVAEAAFWTACILLAMFWVILLLALVILFRSHVGDDLENGLPALGILSGADVIAVRGQVARMVIAPAARALGFACFG